MRNRCRRPGNPRGLQLSLPTPEREPTWYEAGWRWLETYVATARNVKGQRLAACRFTRYVAGSLLHISLRRLSGDHIRKFRLELEHDHHLSPYTVMHVLSDLRCFLRWAVDAGILERTPFPARVMPRIAETLARGLSEPEVAHLVRFPGRAGFVLRLLLETGLRWAESCQVTRHDVRGSLLEIAHTKSGRVRRVPLSPGLIEEIGEIDGPLNPFSPRSPGSFSRRVRRVSDITGFHVHRCRHTFAIRWLEAGGNLAVLQQILGHRDLSTTMRYARVTDDLVRREAERVAKVRKASRRMDDPR